MGYPAAVRAFAAALHDYFRPEDVSYKEPLQS